MSVLDPAAALRSRSGWEAADMGVLLWRANWIPILCFFGIPAGIFVTILHFLPESVSVAAAVVWWWLKPLMDRFCLQVVSVRFFEPRASLKRLFSGLGRTLRSGLAGDLLWRRFSPCRSTRMPIAALEHLKGKNRRRRKLLLDRNGLGFGTPLTVICLLLNSILLLGELAFVYGIFDLIQPGYTGTLDELINQRGIWFLIFSWFNLTLVETIYVCMGFGVYINARVETEGWDIEILFNQCVNQCVEKAGSGFRKGSAAAAKAAVLVLLLFAARPLAAEEPVLQPLTLNAIPAENQQALDGVLESHDFGYEKPGWEVELKKTPERPKNLTPRKFNFPWLQELLGKFLRLFMGVVIAAAVVAAAVFLYRRKGFFAPRGGPKSYGRPVAAEDPRKLLEAAVSSSSAGRLREAWALCFRAFLAAFAQVRGIPLSPETTEYEALAQVRRAGDANSTVFESFVQNWIGFAYGGRDPAPRVLEKALASCRSLLDGAP